MITTESESTTPVLDADEFEDLRRYLFTIAYRLTGSASESEDIVQEAYLRARDRQDEPIRSHKAYLATVVTRLSLDYLRLARTAREVYVGPWLPEPVPTTDLAPTPLEAAEQREDVSLAFLVLLERLAPEERAAYVLREAFAYPYDDIAETLGKSTSTVRQLTHRARARVAAGRTRFPVTPEKHRRLAERFLAASQSGDLTELRNILAADATGLADAGAATHAARRPINGRDAVSRWIQGVMTKWLSAWRMTLAEVNGSVAVFFWDHESLHAVLSFDMAGEEVSALCIILNPEKLAYLSRRLRENPDLLVTET
jgi:RNA polymerase sigma-70 factor (ECF subfamily)